MKFEIANNQLHINGETVTDRQHGHQIIHQAQQQGAITDSRIAVAFRSAVSIYFAGV